MIILIVKFEKYFGPLKICKMYEFHYKGNLDEKSDGTLQSLIIHYISN